MSFKNFMMPAKLLIVGTVCSFGQAIAQSAAPAILNSTGGSAIISGNTYEWSAGEMTSVSTSQAGNIIITQGLLQPVNGSAAIEENNSFPGLFLVYPVPTFQTLVLEPHFETGGKLEWVLYSTWGKELQRQNVQLHTGTETQILDLSILPAAHYFLRLRFESPAGLKYSSYTVQKL